MNKGLYSSLTCEWDTPRWLYAELEAMLGPFDMDPTPKGHQGLWSGLALPWQGRVFLNPPYGRTIGQWVQKAYQASQEGVLVACLLPARTDTRWWQEYVDKSKEVWFIRGRLKFNDAGRPAPFPSALVLFGNFEFNGCPPWVNWKSEPITSASLRNRECDYGSSTA